MTTERNAQGVDGLAEVMGLLEKATPGEWQHDRYAPCNEGCEDYLDISVWANMGEEGEQFIGNVAFDVARPDDCDAICAAVNYLRSHGEAIRELVEAARAARAYSTIPSTQFRELIKTMGWDGAEDTARFVSRLLDAALAKFPEPRP